MSGDAQVALWFVYWMLAFAAGSWWVGGLRP